MARRVTEAEIRKAAAAAGIPYRLFYAVVGQESGGRSGAVSPAGARGAAQLMPGTAKALEQRYGIDTSTPYGNLLGGAYYLREQKDRFKTWRLALAAYNAGPGRVKEYGGVPPIRETQDYVRNILAKARVDAGKTAARGGASSSLPAPGAPPELIPGQPAVYGQDPYTPKDVALEGLLSLTRGEYDPMQGLQSLSKAAAIKAPLISPATSPQIVSGAPVASGGMPGLPKNVKGGLTYSGQKLTHDTDGLPGYPAVDLFAKPGTPFLAPEDGRVVRLSGRGGTSGNVYGWSVYFLGKSGRKYFITHLNKQRARGRLAAGDVIGTVSPWDGGATHAHVGIHEPRRRGR